MLWVEIEDIKPEYYGGEWVVVSGERVAGSGVCQCIGENRGVGFSICPSYPPPRPRNPTTSLRGWNEGLGRGGLRMLLSRPGRALDAPLWNSGGERCVCLWPMGRRWGVRGGWFGRKGLVGGRCDPPVDARLIENFTEFPNLVSSHSTWLRVDLSLVPSPATFRFQGPTEI